MELKWTRRKVQGVSTHRATTEVAGTKYSITINKPYKSAWVVRVWTEGKAGTVAYREAKTLTHAKQMVALWLVGGAV